MAAGPQPRRFAALGGNFFRNALGRLMDERRPTDAESARPFPVPLRSGCFEPLPARTGLVLLLVAVCFVPRAVFALGWNQLWTDSVSFHNASVALAQGHWDAAFGEFGLNLYPIVLWLLRSLFADWETAAKWFSVAAASAAVLPLFGWTRRQFDDRVATVACLCYAVHGKLVAMSCLAIRDPLFWLLVLTAFYLFWRAAVEQRWWLHLASGVVLLLTVHLRTEGWLLLVPLLGWNAIRAYWGGRPALVRSALGVAMATATVPLCLCLVNTIWLRDAPQWSLLRRDHARLLRDYLWSPSEKDAAAPAGGSTSPEGIDGKPAANESPPTAANDGAWATDFNPLLPGAMSSAVVARKLVVQLIKAYTYPLGILAIVGTTAWFSVYRRGEHLIMLLMGLLLLAAVWIRSAVHSNDPRYFIPIVLASLPWMALGAFRIGAKLEGLLTRFGAVRCRNVWAAALLGAAVLIPSVADMKLSWGRYMVAHAQLGRWIEAQFGGEHTIAANTAELRLVQYYSNSRLAGFFHAVWPHPPEPPAVLALQPDFVLIWYEDSDAGFSQFADHLCAASDGRYIRVPAEQLPPHWIVCRRAELAPRRPQ